MATYMDGSGRFPISCTTVMDEYSIRNLLSNVAMLQEDEGNTTKCHKLILLLFWVI